MTIKDLAIKTGYAVGTVSRALNGHPNVSEKARTAILAAAQECGFQLNQNAKQLKQIHSTNILLVVKGTRNDLFAEMIEAIQGLVAETPYQLAVDYMDEDSNEVLRALRLIPEKKPLGILFLGGNTGNFAEHFAAIDVPCVLVTSDASGLPFENLSSVTIDDRQAACEALELLISLGHRHIAVIGGDPAISDTSRLRMDGCLDAFRSRGIPFDPEKSYRAVRYSYQGGYEAAQDLLSQGRSFTAIFAAADVIAIGAIRALAEQGLKVPEDVSVMGVDGLPLGSYLVPRLATVRQNVRDLAKRSLQVLLAAIEDSAPARHEIVPYAIVQRESIRQK